MSGKPSFSSELKRRNAYKVAVAYEAIAWLTIQAASPERGPNAITCQ